MKFIKRCLEIHKTRKKVLRKKVRTKPRYRSRFKKKTEGRKIKETKFEGKKYTRNNAIDHEKTKKKSKLKNVRNKISTTSSTKIFF